MWLLWKDNTVIRQAGDLLEDSIIDTPTQVTQTTPVASSQASASLTRQTVSVIDKVINEVKVSDLNIDNYLADDAANAEGGSEDKNLTDRAYVAAYAKLTKENKVEANKFTETTITSVSASVNDDATVDHFNRVDVSNSKNTVNGESKSSLAKLVTAVVNTEDKPDEKKPDTPAWKDYLESLKPAEAERKNEVRTITVREGETLWRIAMRAYGNGFMYKKIFEANPHLTSPNAITTGEVLRVPL